MWVRVPVGHSTNFFRSVHRKGKKKKMSIYLYVRSLSLPHLCFSFVLFYEKERITWLLCLALFSVNAELLLSRVL